MTLKISARTVAPRLYHEKKASTFLAKRRASLRLVSERTNSRRNVLCFQWAFPEFFRRRQDAENSPRRINEFVLLHFAVPLRLRALARNSFFAAFRRLQNRGLMEQAASGETVETQQERIHQI